MNALVPSQGGIPVGTQQGSWQWDGQNWICVPCSGDIVPPFPCPPPGFPPAGCPPWFSGANSPPWYPGANAGVSFGSVAPMNAVRGHFWWNGHFLSIFDGAVWVNAATGVIVPPDGGGGGGGGSTTGTVIISSTPPGNPSPGTQWWNGSILQMWDGVSWKIIGPGSAAGPVPTTTIMFAITQPTSAALSGSNWTIVPLSSTPQVDTLLGWNATTHKYMPNKAGMYEFAVRNIGPGGSAVVKNDSGNFTSALGSDIVVAISSDSDPTWVQSSGITLMNGTTDFVRMWAWAESGTLPAAGGNPVLSAILLP